MARSGSTFQMEHEKACDVRSGSESSCSRDQVLVLYDLLQQQQTTFNGCPAGPATRVGLGCPQETCSDIYRRMLGLVCAETRPCCPANKLAFLLCIDLLVL